MTHDTCKYCKHPFPALNPELPQDIREYLLQVDACSTCLDDKMRGRSMKWRHVKKRIKARARWAEKLSATL